MDLRADGRILYVSSVDVSIGNGPGVNEREFVLGLHSAIKERAHFLIPRPARDVDELRNIGCTYVFPHRRHNPLLYPAHVSAQVIAAQRLLQSQRFDLIVFRLDVLPVGPYVITRNHRVPYALKTVGQGMLNVLGERLGVIGKVLARVNLRIVRRMVEGAICGDSVSKAQVEYLHQLLGSVSSKIVWIDNAVNTKRFCPVATAQARQELGLARYNPIVCYVGSRPWERGGMQLIEVAPRLIHRYRDLGIVIVGNGGGAEALQKAARERGVAEHCVLTGYVPFDQVPKYINACDVGVSISLRPDRSAASELKVRQYLACGKPVVISPGSNEFVVSEKLGTIVPPNDMEAIGAALEEMLSQGAGEREGFARRAAQYMKENLSIEAAIARRLTLWSERLESR